MSYPKNAATPPRIAVGAVVQISDGAVQTSGVSIRLVPQGGSAAAGLGTTSYEDGIVLYAPTQAETNYDAFCVIAYKTGCIPAATTVVTSDTATAGRVRLSGENHSGATIPTVTTITNAVTAGTVSDKTGYTLSASGLASITAWTVAITGNITGNVSGSVGSVASGVTVTTNNDKTGYSLTQSFPSNFASLAITAGGAVTAGTVSDKTGYSLTQSFPTNFSSLAITAGGSVTAGTVSDKTGYSLTQAFPTNFSSMAISASGVVDANTVLWGGSTLPTVGTSTLTASQVWSHAARTLTAFAFTPNVNVTQWDGGSLPTIGTSTLTASDVWTHATRTLTAFGFNVTVGTNNDKTGYSLATAPLDASGTAAAVWGALLASYTTAGTFGARILRTDSASAGNGAKVTAAGHVAADIHELQPAVITAADFAAGAIDANALAADAASEVASAVRTNLATELARIDVASSTLASQSSVNTLTTYVDTEVAAIKAKTDNLPANPAATSDIPSAITIADAVLSRSVANVEGSAAEHTLCTLVLAILESDIVGSTWTIKRTNGITTHYPKTVGTDANALPIVSVQ